MSAVKMDDRTTSCESRDADKKSRQIKLDEKAERDYFSHPATAPAAQEKRAALRGPSEMLPENWIVEEGNQMTLVGTWIFESTPRRVAAAR
jgi:hypothetical protein